MSWHTGSSNPHTMPPLFPPEWLGAGQGATRTNLAQLSPKWPPFNPSSFLAYRGLPKPWQPVTKGKNGQGRKRDKRSERSHVWEVCPHAFVCNEGCVSIKKTRRTKNICLLNGFQFKRELQRANRNPQVWRWWLQTLVACNTFITHQ